MTIPVDGATLLVMLNIVATLAGIVGLWIKLEHRLTKIETIIEMYEHIKKERHGAIE